MSASRPRRNPAPWIDDAALGAALLTIYIVTLHPSVPGGDSGELIAVAWTGGVAHPPGYPLYTLLAGAFARLLPIGEAAWRVNLFSAVCATLTAVLLRRLVAEWGGSRVAGLAAAALFALSPLVWTWAVAAEVFALNNLFAAALLLLAWRWSRSGNPRIAYVGAGLLGLGLTNHHTLILLGAPLAAWIFLRSRSESMDPVRCGPLIVAFVAGLTPYLYLPLAASLNPEIAWGDTATLSGFLHHVLRRDYGTLRLGGELPAGHFFGVQLSLYGRSLAQNTLWLGGIVGALGCVVSMRRSTFPGSTAPARSRGDGHELGRVLFASWVAYIVVFHYAANLPVDRPLYREVTARFWQQPNLIVFLWIGLGLAWIAHRSRSMHRALLPATALLLVVAQVAIHFKAQNQRHNRFVADYAAAILEPLPRGAVLLTFGDLVTNSVRYLQFCDGIRPDVVVIDQELATRSWYIRRLAARHRELFFPGSVYDPGAPDGFSMRQWIEANAGRLIWVYPELRSDDATTASFEAWPVGLPSQVLASGGMTRVGIRDWQQRSRHALDELRAFPWPGADRYAPGTWERVVLDDLWQAKHRLAVRLLESAIETGDDPALLDAARALLEEIVSGHPDPAYFVYKNLGIAYDRVRAGDPQLLALRDDAWGRYLMLAPSDDPGRDAIAAAVGH